MGLITQEIVGLIGGVSQAPHEQRSEQQLDHLTNGLIHPVRGTRKRPPSVHVAKLLSSVTGYATAFAWAILRSTTEQYRAIVINGDLKVFDGLTGSEATVYFPAGKTYLSGSDFRAVTSGDRTFLLNRGTTVAKDVTQAAASRVYEALLVIQQGDYDTVYSVTLTSGAITRTVSYKTPSSSRTAIASDAIALAVMQALQANSTINSLFTFTRYGSAIYVVTQDGSDFTITATDGLSNQGMLAIKGKVQRFDQLPASAKAGMVVEVEGLPESPADNYFVTYQDSGMPGQAGVWTECPAPGVLTDLDPLTMPHMLDYQGDILQQQENHAPPALPAVGNGVAASTAINGWQKVGAVAVDEDTDHTVDGHNDYFETVPDGTNGTGRTVTVTFDLDARNIDALTSVTVAIYTDNGAGYSLIQSQVYDNRLFLEQQFEIGFPLMAAGAKVKLLMTYSGGSTPGLTARAILTGHGALNTSPGVLTQAALASDVEFVPADLYPVAATVTVTLDGTDFTHTVDSTDETGTAVAAALKTLIDASATYVATNPEAGVVSITRTDGARPVASASIGAFSASTKFWAPGVGMTASEHIGRTIRNLTDGSSAVITANSTSTITVAALTGGSANTFRPGDKCSVVGTGAYFVFAPAPWDSRAAGDDTTVPFPAFVGRTIDEVFVYGGRLGVTSRETITLSQAGKLTNFFRQTATDLLADDMIEVRSASQSVPQFFGAVEWADGVYLQTDHAVARLSGSPALTPSTVRLDFLGAYPNASNIRPALADKFLFLASQKNGYTRIGLAMRPQVQDESSAALDVKDTTKHVPVYLAGSPLVMACDPQAQMLVVSCSGEAGRLYVLAYGLEAPNGEQVDYAWSRWDLSPGSLVLSLDILNGVIGLVIKRTDGIFLETITLDPDAVTTLLLGDGTGFGDGEYNGSGLLF